MGNFSDLPGEIALEIFTRLPTESVVDCKSVSKTWKNLLHNPSFYQTHSNHLLLGKLHSSSANSGKKISFVFMLDHWLYYLEYDDNDVSSSANSGKKLIFHPPFVIYDIVASCNGLICIQGTPLKRNRYEFTSSYVAYICNPITRECITLPEFNTSTYDHSVDFMLCGFGYVATTNEYKVVRLCIFLYKFALIEVYTLGSGKGWRNAGTIDIDGHDSVPEQHGVFVDGFLYWNFEGGKTMAFDLAGETFVEISKSWKGRLCMGVLGGYLFGTQYKDQGASSDVWLLKKEADDESFGWSKEFNLFTGDRFPFPLAITSCHKVLCCSDSKLYLYDTQSSSSKMLQDFRTTIRAAVPHINTFVSLDFRTTIRAAVPHINTFVSLKAFGEENTETLEAGGSHTNSDTSRKRKIR